ncbi:Polyphosphate kinase [Chloroherpeton thalassium ATCC 35110]|uniref:Polyphosphate kinase n=1 Tax=Chloroherpeton thalassium (strain ATCC 35110 / GB-78) TaxID=517418 RepID=B3QY85_CHLT3|nr:polyphosphate kinase 1 [Chloroherpeton thalassium]ACF15051.1 Polyphosphate kinase [Chloroherpeton thalassium ATCC 35110]
MPLSPKEDVTLEREEPIIAEPIQELDRQEHFINRELSWIEFNKRVLHEALSESHPLLERAKFISIFSSNLDEFFMIRVAGLEGQYEAGVAETSIDGLTPLQQLEKIKQEVELLLEKRNECFYQDIAKKLEQENIHFYKYALLSPEQQKAVSAYFDKEIFPVLTPLAFDPGHPFPYVSNLSLSLAIQLKGENSTTRFARVKVPTTLPRLVRLDCIAGIELKPGEIGLLWLEDVISGNLEKLFSDVEILEVHPFRVTRDADIEIEEDEAGDLLETIEKGIRQRRYGSVVKLDINPEMPANLKRILMENLRVPERRVYKISHALDLSKLMELMKINRPNLKDSSFVPREVIDRENGTIFSEIRRKNILLYHPYDSFQPVVDFIQQAAADPDVLAIKQTLYRVGSQSPVVKALIEAAERGKQVAVLVELKARFDEENNIVWAKALEKVGVHVVYGLLGLKTHSKIALVVRREQDGLRRYVHLGTGNYNPSTAKIYTDYSFFTCDEELGADASDLFNYLTGYSKRKHYRRLIVSPFNTRNRIIDMIQREIEQQRKHGNGHIIMKMNSLVDPKTIKSLYRASQEGVQIDLIVRGICSLKPKLAGLSENIRVISIVGRFLEHSRAFYFHNNGKDEIYLGSADMMQRNLDRRVETLFPILDEALRRRIKTDLELMLKDNKKAWELDADGCYRKQTIEGIEIDSQHLLLTNDSSQEVIKKTTSV